MLLNSITRATGEFYVALPITFVIVVALAAGVHYLVEKPSLEMGRRIANRPRFRREDPGERRRPGRLPVAGRVRRRPPGPIRRVLASAALARAAGRFARIHQKTSLCIHIVTGAG